MCAFVCVRLVLVVPLHERRALEQTQQPFVSHFDACAYEGEKKMSQ